jgi:hypothetical protein
MSTIWFPRWKIYKKHVMLLRCTLVFVVAVTFFILSYLYSPTLSSNSIYLSIYLSTYIIYIHHSAFSAITDQNRNFDERFFNGEGPFNDNRETDGDEALMALSANRIYRIKDNIVPSRRVLLPTYDSLLNYTYLTVFGPEMRTKNFFTNNATALEIMDNVPPYIANFNLTSSKCDLNTIMCCFTGNRLGATVEDNTDVCQHDLECSYFANNVRHGYGVFDSEYPAYCSAFKWDSDPNSASFQYRGNALFDLSFGTFLRDGYVKNIPGAPLCSCLENMPVVTNAACRDVDVSNERYTLTYNGNGIKVVQDSVKVTFSDCGGQDFLSYHTAANLAPEVWNKIKKRITPDCAEAEKNFFLMNDS